MVNVIVVDDEEDVQFLFEQEFYEDIESYRIKFHFFLTAIEALAYINSIDINNIDYIISDICMPGINGLDFLKKIKEDYPQSKIIMITASVNKEYYEIAKEYGAEDYMVKPIDFNSLKQKFFFNNKL